jgi:ribose transport system substrate-binding protein
VLAACSSSGNSAGGGRSVSSGALAQAKAEIVKYSTPPTTVGISTPLKSKPTGVKTVIMMSNSTAESTQVSVGVQAAVAALGWRFEHVVLKADAPSIQNAFDAAIQKKPDLIIGDGLDPSILTAQRAKMAKAGIPEIDVATPYPADASNKPLAILEGGAKFTFMGQLEADWVVAKGGAVNSIYVSLADRTAGTDASDGYTQRMKKLCPSCSVKVLVPAVTDIGSNLPLSIVSAIQKDPSIKYVSFLAGSLTTGVSAALSQAGLKAKIVAIAPEPSDFAAMRQGSMDMGVGYALQASGWKAIDVFLRHLEGDTFAKEATGPSDTSAVSFLSTQILTAKNAPTAGYWNGDANYQAAFKKLWHLG